MFDGFFERTLLNLIIEKKGHLRRKTYFKGKLNSYFVRNIKGIETLLLCFILLFGIS